MHIPFKLLFALTIFVCSMSALNWAMRLHTEPWDAETFAVSEAKSRGLEGWPVESVTSVQHEHRVLLRCPDDGSRFADMTVRLHEGQWSVVKFNKDFRPWGTPAATASR